MTCGAGRNTRKQPTPSVCFAGLEMHACAWIDARRAPRRKQTSAHAGLAYAVATCTIFFTTSPERAMKPESQWMEIGAGHTVCCLVSHACENRHGQQLCDGWLAGVMDRTPQKKNCEHATKIQAGQEEPRSKHAHRWPSRAPQCGWPPTPSM